MRAIARPFPTPRFAVTHGTSADWVAVRPVRFAATNGRPQRSHPGPVAGCGAPLVTAQSAQEPDDPPVRHTRRRPAREPSPIAPVLLREQLRSITSTTPALAPEPLDACLAWQHPTAAAVCPPSHAPLRNHRDGILAIIRLWLSKRPPRRRQLQDPADQPPQLRLPLHRRPHRPRLPLLHPTSHRPAAMNFTPNRL